jgi:hypoxanthine phosphoribosyltransferase
MKKLVLDDREIKNLTSKICRDIVGSRWHPDYVVGITRGGLTPAVMISHWFDVPCETLKVSLRDGGESESNLWMAEEAFGYVPADDREFTEGEKFSKENRKNILIVDDINDTGATINWIVKDWPGGCMPNETAAWERVWGNNVRFAVLVDNLASKCEVKMDFCGREINKAENDVWVDFPWENWWSK